MPSARAGAGFLGEEFVLASRQAAAQRCFGEFQAKSKYRRMTKDLESKDTVSHNSYKFYRSPKFDLIFQGER